MYPEIYNKDGRCLRCKGTKKCHSCGGSGARIIEKGDILSEGTKVPCRTCFGAGYCVFCRNRKKQMSLAT